MVIIIYTMENINKDDKKKEKDMAVLTSSEYVVLKRDKDFKEKEKKSYKAFSHIISKKNEEANIKLLQELLDNDRDN